LHRIDFGNGKAKTAVKSALFLPMEGTMIRLQTYEALPVVETNLTVLSERQPDVQKFRDQDPSIRGRRGNYGLADALNLAVAGSIY
jgi:hypothetical protein